MFAQTGLWLVIGHHEENGPWDYGYLTVRAEDHMQAARKAAAYTKRTSETHPDPDMRVPMSDFPDKWIVTELGLSELCPQGIVREEIDGGICLGLLRGDAMAIELVQGISYVVRL